MKSAPTATVTPLRDFSDRLSPMVVKELRHGLRTKFFSASLICFHWLLIMLMGSTLLGVSTERVNELFWNLAIFSMLGVLPLRGSSALAGEVESCTLDMLTLTSIPSFRIVYGKWAALFSQSLLMACSLLPYMVARYHFGGVEIFRETVALLILLLGSALATAAFVAFSSQTARALRSLLVLALAAGLVPLGILVYQIAIGSEGDEIIREFLALKTWERGSLVGGVLSVCAYGVYFFIAMGASRIAPASENHSTRKRIVALAVLLTLTVTGCWLSVHYRTETALWALVPAIILTLLNGMDVLTESMPRIPTVVLPFVRRQINFRAIGTVLYPGWCSGVFFFLILATMPMILTIVLAADRRPGGPPLMFVLAVACLLLAPLLPVCIQINRNSRFTNWWTVQMIFIASGILLTVFGGLSRSSGLAGFGILTPITALFGSMIDYRHNDEILSGGVAFGVVWAAVAVAFAFQKLPILRALEADAIAMIRTDRPPPSQT